MPAAAFDHVSDEDLVQLASEHNTLAVETILDRYKPMVRFRAHSYFLLGADREDVIQEGMIGLFKAIRDYDRTKNVSFRSFADVCVRRQMITAIKTAGRQKHLPLNRSVSLDEIGDHEGEGRSLMDVFHSRQAQNPEELLIGRESLFDIEQALDEALTDLEKQVLRGYLAGQTYQEIARLQARTQKTVDNALQRIKKKLWRYLEERRRQGNAPL